MNIEEIPAIQSIAEYLRSMRFKKKFFGGCDIESVLEHFVVVTEKYEEIIRALLQADPLETADTVRRPERLYSEPQDEEFFDFDEWLGESDNDLSNVLDNL